MSSYSSSWMASLFNPSFFSHYTYYSSLLSSTARARSTYLSYFLVTNVGYAIGLIFTAWMSRIYQTPQPALLYLVPGVLIPLCLLAFSRHQFKQIWLNVEDTEEIVPESVMVADLEQGFVPDADDDEHGFSRPRRYSFSQSQSEAEFTNSDLELEPKTSYYPSSSASALASSASPAFPSKTLSIPVELEGEENGKDKRSKNLGQNFGTFTGKSGSGRMVQISDNQAPAYEDLVE